MKTAITICLAPEASAGPFVYHEGLEHGCGQASELGYDAVEIFPRDPAGFPSEVLRDCLQRCSLQAAAFGTGAGAVVHRLSLTDPDAHRRAAAKDFVRKIIRLGGEFGAPAIIGSMQGRFGGEVTRDQALAWLADALQELGEASAAEGQVLLYEPLNRYESNLLPRQAEAAEWLRQVGSPHVRLLCDLFHMNIEEACLATALADAGDLVGHVHWADSNRSAMGLGHTDPGPIADALRRIGYQGYLSAEIFPTPTAREAAQRTIASMRAAC